ncbi:MAG: DUF3108 domain-containing protein [Gemmatimonadales bacterium]|nr:MAG: DUF3108 domain-containing protein [Gemmatimonadales bacterium]
MMRLDGTLAPRTPGRAGGTIGGTIGGAAVTALALGGMALVGNPSLLPAQQGPPPPMEARSISFPEFERFTLGNGIEVVVLSYGTQPVASIRLYQRGGSSLAAPERAGVAGLASTVLTRGTTSRSALDISETIEGVGGTLTAGAGQDFMNVSATVLSEHLEVAFELLADVARNADFPEGEVEIARRQTLSSLQAQLGQPQAIAGRHFNRILYGDDHPYGISPSPESVAAITRDDLVAFRDRALQPEGALLMVAGAVDRDEIERLANRHLGDWTGRPAAPPVLATPGEIQEPRIYLVHRPGSVQSVVLAGRPGVAGDSPDFAAIEVANRVLGGGADSRLFRILREERGWTYGAYSSVSRPAGTGLFTASAEVRTPVTDSTVVELLLQMDRMGSEPVPPDELDAARNYLAGSFPLQLETAGQVAGRLATALLLDRDVEEISDFPARIRAVSSEAVQEVGARVMRPERSVVVVVGDGAQVLEALEAIAPVTLMDIQGEPLDRSEILSPADAEVSWDASRLEEGVRRYELLVQGNPAGTASYRLEREGDDWVSTTTMAQPGGGAQESVLRFGATDFAPRSLRQSQSGGGLRIEVQIDVVDGRMIGKASLPAQLGGEREIDEDAEGLLLPGMDEWAMAAARLEDGTRLRIPYLDVIQGQGTVVEARVVGREEVEVPAGTFDCWRVEVTGEQGTVTLFLRAEGPHILVRQEFPGQPVALELTGVSPL